MANDTVYLGVFWNGVWLTLEELCDEQQRTCRCPLGQIKSSFYGKEMFDEGRSKQYTSLTTEEMYDERHGI